MQMILGVEDMASYWLEYVGSQVWRDWPMQARALAGFI